MAMATMMDRDRWLAKMRRDHDAGVDLLPRARQMLTIANEKALTELRGVIPAAVTGQGVAEPADEAT